MNVKKLFDLSNRTIILTGGAGLLGSQYAEGLSQAGANLILADINYAGCKNIAKQLEKKYQNSILPIKLDLTDQKSIKNMVKKTVKKFSKIDVLINNAAFQGKSGKERQIKFEDLPSSLWDKAISVNLTGIFLSCQEVGKIMIKQKRGVIINIASVYGIVAADQRIYGKSGQNSAVYYAATKSAILNLTRYLASYWNRTGIRVNTLSPGGVENNQGSLFIKNYSYKTMLGRMAQKNEYVGAMIFLASDASSYMTGSNLVVDGGWTAW